MEFAKLKSALKDGVSPAYVLHGSDIYLVNKAIELIIAASGVGNPELNVVRLQGASADEITAACRTVSLFGDKRVVVVRGGEVPVQYLAKPDPSCVLIFVADKTVDGAECVCCDPMPADLVAKVVARQVAEAGRSITAGASELLCRRCDNMYSRIDAELQKMLAYFPEGKTLDGECVEQMVAYHPEHQVFELGSAVAKRDMAGAGRILGRLRASGVEEYAIFGSLVSNFRRLYYALRTTAPNGDVAAVLKCNPFAVQYSRRDHKALADSIPGIYKRALDLEYDIKSGKISVESGVNLCIL